MRNQGKSICIVLWSGWFSALTGCAGGGLPMPLVDPGETEVAAQPAPAVAGDDGVTPCVGSEEPATTTHRAMLDALNLYRQENGLEPLRYSKTLETTIDAHVYDLWARDFFDHVNPDGLRPSDRAVEGGFCHRYVGENIAAGQKTLDRVMQAWIDSEPHRLNLLEERYIYVGVGVFTDPDGRIYWGQLFALDVPSEVE